MDLAEYLRTSDGEALFEYDDHVYTLNEILSLRERLREIDVDFDFSKVHTAKKVEVYLNIDEVILSLACQFAGIGIELGNDAISLLRKDADNWNKKYGISTHIGTGQFIDIKDKVLELEGNDEELVYCI